MYSAFLTTAGDISWAGAYIYIARTEEICTKNIVSLPYRGGMTNQGRFTTNHRVLHSILIPDRRARSLHATRRCMSEVEYNQA